MLLLAVFLILQVLQGATHAQDARCNTVAGGCDNGKAGQAALQGALSAFQDGLIYGGGRDTVVFSSSVSNGVLGQIAYSCRDGSVPPALAGENIRTL